jgi:Asp-tRNA(Asn)/Glu-tRNA(Gln) amidotransferase A subunit family amidase
MKLSIALIGTISIAFNGRNAVTAKDEVEQWSVDQYSRNLRTATKKYPPYNFVQDPIFKEKYGCSITCAPCPIGCTNVTIKCTDKPLYIPPKSPMYLPDNLLHRTFPTGIAPPYPVALPRNATAEAEWFTQTYLSKYPVSTKQENTKYALTATEKMLLKMSLPEWQDARAANKYTCMDMVTASIKRALYLDDVQKMGQFMYMNTFDWVGHAIKEARKYDKIAKKRGTKAIAPMYCYPIPIKGTITTKDFPASNGWPALYPYHGKIDADVVKLLKASHGVQFGLTTIPPIAAGISGWMWESGLCLNPWGTDYQTHGSSAGSASAVASMIATVGITEDTGSSTNGPATRQHLFGYDPPKFHYPNGGNPSLTVRNDQIGVVGRSIDDIIAYDKALLGNDAAHAKAAAYVAGLSNKDIRIGCSNVHYNYTIMTASKHKKYYEAMAILKAAGITFVEECMNVNPYNTSIIPRPYSNSITHDELEYHIKNNLGLNLTTFEVMLNGYYGFSRSTSVIRGPFSDGKGCFSYGVNKTVIDDYLGRVPAAMSDLYNKYFDTHGVDLMMGPTDYCEKATWTDDFTGNCDGGNPIFKQSATSTTMCSGICNSVGVNGGADKMFTKAKFVVPIGLTDTGAWFNLHFMSRAGPKNYPVPASQWVYDEVGPQTWNLEEMYIIKRLYSILTAADPKMKRAEATLNYIDGFL